MYQILSFGKGNQNWISIEGGGVVGEGYMEEQKCPN